MTYGIIADQLLGEIEMKEENELDPQIRIGLSVAHRLKAYGARYGRIIEFHESVKWTDHLTACLEIEGAHVEVAPHGRLPEKVAFLNSKNVDLAVEIHFNAATLSAQGCETLYYPNSRPGKNLAECIQDYLPDAVNTRDRGVKEGWYHSGRINDGGERKATPLYFLKKTNCPALIIEPEFVYQNDRIIAARESGPEAICQGILEYLG